VDTFRSVEASLRVDALASAGFRISRSKLVALIRCFIGLCFQQVDRVPASS
jgi:RNA-binding protein YlmH